MNGSKCRHFSTGWNDHHINNTPKVKTMKHQGQSLNPGHLEAVQGTINRAPFFRHMSMRVVELDIGFSKVVARIEDNHMNPFGALHGGVYSSILDTAAYWSAYCDLPEEQGLVSIDLKVDFLGPVVGQEAIVTGKRVKAGKTLFLAEAQMFCGSNKLVAHGTSKLMVIQNKQTICEAVDYMSAEKLPPKYIEEYCAV